jgi:hypothetical protein
MEEPSDVRRDLLYNFLFDNGWTGGGEIEFIQDQLGQTWLIEINPRFPPLDLWRDALREEPPSCVVTRAHS